VIRHVAVTVCLAGIVLSAHDDELVQRDVYLMGTRARLSTYAGSRDAGLATLDSALRILEGAEQELSTWRRDSRVSALNRQPIGLAWQAAPALCRMFAEVYRWQASTGGAFDPSIGRLLDAWDIHGEGRLPTRAELSTARRSSGLGLLAFDERLCTLTRVGDMAIDVGAFGKGEALDRVAAMLGRTPWMIDLGGQISAGAPPPGGISWSVAIAHPLDRTRPHFRVRLSEGSLSTSAGSERDLQVNGTRVGHILDPRTGQPAAFRGSVTVWHRSGLAADALSTALYVMGPDEGLRWADAHGISACYLTPDHGSIRVAMTPSFTRLIDE
jgi:thiamine biosynthesis lipoprotein